MNIIRCRAVRLAFLALVAGGVCWVPPVAAAGDLLLSNELECRLGLKRCKGIALEADEGSDRRVALQAIQFEYDSDRLTRPALAQM